MKALYIYNPFNAVEVALISRAQEEMKGYIEVLPLYEAPEILRRFIRDTPALITSEDHLQGERLMADGVDGKLLATATLYKRLEEDEAAIHQAETHRLDVLINEEKTKAIDDYTLELIEGGILI